MKMHLVLHVSGKNTSNQNSSTIQHWLEREKKKKQRYEENSGRGLNSYHDGGPHTELNPQRQVKTERE